MDEHLKKLLQAVREMSHELEYLRSKVREQEEQIVMLELEKLLMNDRGVEALIVCLTNRICSQARLP